MKKYVCIDIGGTDMKYGLADAQGNFWDKGIIPTEVQEKGIGIIFDKIAMIAEKYQKQDNLAGIAISSPGVVDAERGEIVFAGVNFPGYSGTKVRAIVEERCQLPCTVENDVNAAGLGENWLGAGKGAKSVFCMAVGTGIGGCLILNHHLIHGVGNSAGEVGFLKINAGGTLEETSSTGQLVREMAKIRKLSANDLNGKIIFEWAKNGDEDAKQAIKAMTDRLAAGIAAVCYVFDPEIVILGGGIMSQEAYLRPLIEKALDNIMAPALRSNSRLAFAKLHNDAGMLGALCYFLQCNEPEFSQVFN